MNRVRLALLGIAVAGAVGVARAQTPAINVIETRQAGQDVFYGSFIGMEQGAKHQVEAKAFADSAAAMARWMRNYPSLFPVGSDQGQKNRALPTIWSDRAGFLQADANLVAAADKLAQLAKADDNAGFAAQIKTVGDACTACHNKFRAK